MTTTQPASEQDAHRTAGARPTPRFARRSDGRLVGGVSTGLADHLGVQPLSVRITFALLAALGGFGVVLYLALWVFTPLDQTLVREQADRAPAGVAAATRAGMRARIRAARPGDLGQLAALVLLGLGIVGLLQNTPFGVSPGLLIPLLLAGFGVALIWRTADEKERERMAELVPNAPWLAAITGTNRTGSVIRIVAGAAVIVGGVITFLAGQGQLDATLDGLLGVIVVIGGIALIGGPWLWRMWRELDAERRERIISQERADMAAHLHDSVLQTLALIQKQAHDPRSVITLARRQERDLRRWLYEDQAGEPASFAAALTKAAADIEDAHGVPVEVVTVGDGELDDLRRAVLNATGEAAVNAAKHSGADSIDIYAEIEGDHVEVFVRDRGSGFDLESIPDDRLGVRRSIIERMERHGGSAQIRSAPGEGTEVRLSTRKDERHD
ncbi:MAG TPA: PspC domain-containing protein [Jiangellales bacterium]|nr:PspC domain-containing protein [Jiangellales bacterium]